MRRRRAERRDACSSSFSTLHADHRPRYWERRRRPPIIPPSRSPFPPPVRAPRPGRPAKACRWRPAFRPGPVDNHLVGPRVLDADDREPILGPHRQVAEGFAAPLRRHHHLLHAQVARHADVVEHALLRNAAFKVEGGLPLGENGLGRPHPYHHAGVIVGNDLHVHRVDPEVRERHGREDARREAARRGAGRAADGHENERQDARLRLRPRVVDRVEARRPHEVRRAGGPEQQGNQINRRAVHGDGGT